MAVDYIKQYLARTVYEASAECGENRSSAARQLVAEATAALDEIMAPAYLAGIKYADKIHLTDRLTKILCELLMNRACELKLDYPVERHGFVTDLSRLCLAGYFQGWPAKELQLVTLLELQTAKNKQSWLKLYDYGYRRVEFWGEQADQQVNNLIAGGPPGAVHIDRGPPGAVYVVDKNGQLVDDSAKPQPGYNERDSRK